MKKKFLLLLFCLPMILSCQSNNITPSISIPDPEENTSSSESSTTSSVPENNVPLFSVDEIISKAIGFEPNKMHYYRKDNFRFEDITYKNYGHFYTLEGKTDSYTDGWDESDLTGYVGFPSDDSIDCFYDVLKADVAIQHARYYSIEDEPNAVNEMTYEDGLKQLKNWENNLNNLLNETYYVLRNDENNTYANPDSLKAELSDNILHITAEKDYTYLYEEVKATYDLTININDNGSFSKVYFKLDDGGSITINSLELEYGENFKVADLNASDDAVKFNPKSYFSQKIDVSFKDIYSPKDKTNTLTVGSAAYLMPYHDYIKNSSDFTYLPQTAVDYWDINVMSSDNEEVISYSVTDKCFVCNKPGKATLTIGNPYNPFLTKETGAVVEVEVIYAEANAIIAHAPYNVDSYVGEAFTNSDVLLDVEVGPYSARQEMIVSSSNENVATVYVNDNNEVMVHGVAVGDVEITVQAKENPSISKTFKFKVVGELTVDKFVGSWADDEYYSTYKMKFAYKFNADKTGHMSLSALDSLGKEVSYEFDFTYELNLSTQEIEITPIPNAEGYVPQKNLWTVKYYTSESLKTYFQYGEYYFGINLTRVSE